MEEWSKEGVAVPVDLMHFSPARYASSDPDTISPVLAAKSLRPQFNWAEPTGI